MENVASLESGLQAAIEIGLEFRGEGADHEAVEDTKLRYGSHLGGEAGGALKGRSQIHGVSARYELSARFGVIAIPWLNRPDGLGQTPVARRRGGVCRLPAVGLGCPQDLHPKPPGQSQR